MIVPEVNVVAPVIPNEENVADAPVKDPPIYIDFATPNPP